MGRSPDGQSNAFGSVLKNHMETIMSRKSKAFSTVLAVVFASAVLVPTLASADPKRDKLRHHIMTMVEDCMSHLPTDNHMSNDQLTHQFMTCMNHF